MRQKEIGAVRGQCLQLYGFWRKQQTCNVTTVTDFLPFTVGSVPENGPKPGKRSETQWGRHARGVSGSKPEPQGGHRSGIRLCHGHFCLLLTHRADILPPKSCLQEQKARGCGYIKHTRETLEGGEKAGAGPGPEQLW